MYVNNNETNLTQHIKKNPQKQQSLLFNYHCCLKILICYSDINYFIRKLITICSIDCFLTKSSFLL